MLYNTITKLKVKLALHRDYLLCINGCFVFWLCLLFTYGFIVKWVRALGPVFSVSCRQYAKKANL